MSPLLHTWLVQQYFQQHHIPLFERGYRRLAHTLLKSLSRQKTPLDQRRKAPTRAHQIQAKAQQNDSYQRNALLFVARSRIHRHSLTSRLQEKALSVLLLLFRMRRTGRNRPSVQLCIRVRASSHF